MDRDRTRCPHCGKFLKPYIKCSDLCQKCYRELLEQYSYYDYKDTNAKMPKVNTKAYKVLQYVLNDHLTPNEIAKKLDTNAIYVRLIISKYLYKCDVNGNPRPSYMGD